MVRYGVLFLLISFIIVGCQSEESFTGTVTSVNQGLDKKLGISIFERREGEEINLEKIKSVELIMVELPGPHPKQIKLKPNTMDGLPGAEQGQKIMRFLADEYDYKVTARFVAPEREGTTPGFLYHNNEDIAIALLKQGYLKVEKDSKYANTAYDIWDSLNRRDLQPFGQVRSFEETPEDQRLINNDQVYRTIASDFTGYTMNREGHWGSVRGQIYGYPNIDSVNWSFRYTAANY